MSRIDDLDRDILDLLAQDGRMSIQQLAKSLDRRRATIHSRIAKLTEDDVIRGYTVIPDYVALNRPISAFILASVLQEKYEKIESFETIGELISRLPEVTEVHSTTGEFDYLIKVRVAKIEDIGRNIIFKLRKEFGIGRTLTLSIFHTSKEELDTKDYL